MVNTQIDTAYLSAPQFLSAFSTTLGSVPKDAIEDNPLSIDWLETPLGAMIAVTSEDALYLLEFADRKLIDRQFQKLRKLQRRAISPGQTHVSKEAQDQLSAYFEGNLKSFTLPLKTSGTVFQNKTWDQLCAIPYGQTRSYAELACAVGNDKAVRAVAGSNAANGLAIVIPCHRVIRTGGDLGGYAGNLSRKRWLLAHEARLIFIPNS